jgi:hypothetical protein
VAVSFYNLVAGGGKMEIEEIEREREREQEDKISVARNLGYNTCQYTTWQVNQVFRKRKLAKIFSKTQRKLNLVTLPQSQDLL